MKTIFKRIDLNGTKFYVDSKYRKVKIGNKIPDHAFACIGQYSFQNSRIFL